MIVHKGEDAGGRDEVLRERVGSAVRDLDDRAFEALAARLHEDSKLRARLTNTLGPEPTPPVLKAALRSRRHGFHVALMFGQLIHSDVLRAGTLTPGPHTTLRELLRAAFWVADTHGEPAAGLWLAGYAFQGGPLSPLVDALLLAHTSWHCADLSDTGSVFRGGAPALDDVARVSAERDADAAQHPGWDVPLSRWHELVGAPEADRPAEEADLLSWALGGPAAAVETAPADTEAVAAEPVGAEAPDPAKAPATPQIEPEVPASEIPAEAEHAVEPDVETVQPDVEPEVAADVEPQVAADVEPQVAADPEPEAHREVEPVARAEEDVTVDGPLRLDGEDLGREVEVLVDAARQALAGVSEAVGEGRAPARSGLDWLRRLRAAGDQLAAATGGAEDAVLSDLVAELSVRVRLGRLAQVEGAEGTEESVAALREAAQRAQGEREGAGPLLRLAELLEGESAPAYHDVAPLLSELPSELHAALLAASHGLLHLPSGEHVAPDEGTATEGSEPEGTPRMNGPVALDTEPQDEAVEPAGPPGVETDPDEPEPAEVEHEPVEAAEDEHEPVEAEYEPVAGEQEEAAYPSLDEPTFAEEPAWGTHEADEAALTQDLELGNRDERGHDPQEDVETDDRWGVDMGGEQDLETWGEPDTEDRQEDVAADPPGFEVPQEAEPVAEPAPETAADTAPPQEEAAPAAPQETRSEKWSNLAMVLVVDDDPSIRDLLQVVLDRHKVLLAADGEEALRKLAEQPVDAVVLDVMMPHVDGMEVLRRIRADARHRDMIVILLTARADEDDHLRGFREGADAYITKPFDPETLVKTLNEVLERSPEKRAAIRESEKERAALLRQLERRFR
jgi:CheY-like chemotaxis protein